MAAPLHVPFCPPHRRAAYSYSSEAQIYAPASAAPYFEAQGGGGAQVTTAASSPTAIPSHNMVGITMDIGGSQILSGSGAYLIHGGLENSRHSLSHTSRSSPATVCSPAGTAARGPGMIPKGTEKPSENKTDLSFSLYMCVTCHECRGENRHWCTTRVFSIGVWTVPLIQLITEIRQHQRRFSGGLVWVLSPPKQNILAFKDLSLFMFSSKSNISHMLSQNIEIYLQL